MFNDDVPYQNVQNYINRCWAGEMTIDAHTPLDKMHMNSRRNILRRNQIYEKIQIFSI